MRRKTADRLAKIYLEPNQTGNDFLNWVLDCLLGMSCDPNQWLEYYAEMDDTARLEFRLLVGDQYPELMHKVLVMTSKYKS